MSTRSTLIPSFAIFRHKAYLHYWVMRQLNSGARQMQAVAMGWQVYELARLNHGVKQSALFLGFIGLAQFLPVLLLSLIGGQAADRFDRKLILILTNIARFLCAFALIGSVFLPINSALTLLFSVAVVLGIIYAFAPAASSSLYPTLVPRREIQDAIAWNSLGYQVSAIGGPAIGGLVYIFGAQYVYLIAAGMGMVGTMAILSAPTPKHKPVIGAHGLSMIIEGLKYIKGNKVVLGAISLDLVVVFFGGVTALLPIFAKDVLHVGALELGLMRTAPAIGAFIVAFILAARPLTRNIGRYLLISIFIYGLSMLGFAISKVLILSTIALAITGAADMISVYIRQSLIQLSTPDNMRGRVTSVDFIFIGASNELGEFESGIAARFLGPVGAVILGGCVAITAALVWPKIFPEVANADTIKLIDDE
ncbi:MAG: MFS transporter [Robiginitomaculum sp.]|nr:MAG: MFS transporter [Robiginitomaculum sp.]